MPSELLTSAIERIKAGNLQEGRVVLLGYLRDNPTDEVAWMWLAQTYGRDAEKIKVLEECLKNIPNSQIAQQALHKLKSRVQPEPDIAPGRPVTFSTTSFTPSRAPSNNFSNLRGTAATAKRTIRPYTEEEEVKPQRSLAIRIIMGILVTLIVICVAALGYFIITGQQIPGLDSFLASNSRTPITISLPLFKTPFVIYQPAENTPVSKTNPVAVPTLAVIPTEMPVESITGIPEPTPATTLPPPPLTFEQIPANREEITATNLGQVRLLANLGSGAIYASTSNLIAKYQGNQVILWDATKNARSQALTLPSGLVESILFSPDDNLIAVSSSDFQVYLFDITSGRLVKTLAFPGQEIARIFEQNISSKLYPRDIYMRFAPDSRSLAASSLGIITLWNIDDGRVLAYIAADSAKVEQVYQSNIANPGSLNSFFLVDFSPDSHKMVAAGYDLISVYDTNTGNQLYQFTNYETTAHIAIDFSANGGILGVSGKGYVNLVSTSSWQLLFSLPGLQGYDKPASFVFTPDGKGVLVEEDGECCSQVVIKKYNITSGKVETTSAPAAGPVDQLGFSPDGKISIIASTLTGGVNTLTLNNINKVQFASDSRAITGFSGDSVVIYGFSKPGKATTVPTAQATQKAQLQPTPQNTRIPSPLPTESASQKQLDTQTPILLVPKNDSNVPSFLSNIVELNGVPYFYSLGIKPGLQKYDAKTRQLITIRPMTDTFHGIRTVGKYIYFITSDQNQVYTLWRSDGTTQGTIIVKSSTMIRHEEPPQETAAVNKVFFFVVKDESGKESLWKSNGTESGTIFVKGPFPVDAPPRNLTFVADGLFFTAGDPIHGLELWRSDGSTFGTRLVKDLALQVQSNPHELVNFKNNLYFIAYSDDKNWGLWISDGTEKHTQRVKNFGETINDITNLTPAGNWLYMVVHKPTTIDLWKSDGTSKNTILVKQFPSNAGSAGILGLTYANGIIYMAADDGKSGMELWKTDGTQTGTQLVKDINPYGNSIDRANMTNQNSPLMAAFGKKVIFGASDGTNGVMLWQSDGTDTGSRMIANSPDNPAFTKPEMFKLIGNNLFFQAADPSGQLLLWAYEPH